MTVTDIRRRDLTATVTTRPAGTGAGTDTLTVLAVPLGQTLSWAGGAWRERLDPDVTVDVRGTGRLPMLWRHDELIGSWARELDRDTTALYARGRISDTTLGRDVRTLVDDDAAAGASIGFEVTESHTDDTGTEVITALVLHELSLTPLPAYTETAILSREEPRMNTTPAAPPASDLTPRVDAVEQTAEQTRQSLLAVREQLDQLRTAPAHPHAEYETLAAFMDAAWRGDVRTRALVDQVTGDNPGVVPPAWLTQIAGIVDRPRAVVNAFGTAALPESGMDVHWPYLDPSLDLDTIVAEQAAEKNTVTSVKVPFLRGTASIKTFAGGSDVSYQLIMRSEPSYREAYLRVLANAYARTTEADFSAAVAAVAAGSVTGGPLTDAHTAAGYILEASAAVDDATGAPAQFILAAPDVWITLGKLFHNPPIYGTQNVQGIGQASTLRVEVSGLPVVRARYLAAGTLLVSNDMAGDYHDSGAMVVTADDVAKLGQNVAVWGMSVPVFAYPAGVVDVPTA